MGTLSQSIRRTIIAVTATIIVTIIVIAVLWNSSDATFIKPNGRAKANAHVEVPAVLTRQLQRERDKYMEGEQKRRIPKGKNNKR